MMYEEYEKNTQNQEKNNVTEIEIYKSEENNSDENNNKEECLMFKKQLQKMQKENEKLQNENDKQKQLYYDNLKKIMNILVGVKRLLSISPEEDSETSVNINNINDEMEER